MRFSDHLWQQAAPIYQTIVDHPFNRELADGVLDRGRFLFYLEQDAYYLVRFSRALALIAGRARSAKITRSFLNFAVGALVDERERMLDFSPRLVVTGSNPLLSAWPIPTI